MLSYSEYKKLNESLYGAQVLGLRQPHYLTQQPMGANTEVEESEATENEEIKAEEAEKEEVSDASQAEETVEAQAETEEVKAEETAETEEVKAEETAETEEVQTENDQLEKILSELESLLEGKTTDVVQEVKNNISKIKELLETKEMTDKEKSWWNSVNTQLGETQPGECGHAPSTRIGWGGHESGSCGGTEISY